jgi:uncharacterized protein RhaS with RHS repeats
MTFSNFVKAIALTLFFLGYAGSASARYMQADPVGLEGGINAYAYVEGDPLNGVDPNGLKKIILLKETDPNYPAAVNAPDDPSTCIVISHGSAASVSGMNASQLNTKINGMGCRNMPVKLDACLTGYGENSIGEQLAKLRKNIVIAPDDRTWTTPWGGNFDNPYPPMSLDPKSTFNSIPNLMKPGNWREFNKKK